MTNGFLTGELWEGRPDFSKAQLVRRVSDVYAVTNVYALK